MKIKLPDFVIADLYKNSLVITDDIVASKKQEEPEVKPALYFGGNEKQIAVFVNNPQQRFLDDESLQLLINMLGALRLTVTDIALFNFHQMPFTYKEIATQFGAQVYLLFGVTTQEIELPFQMPDYKVQSFNNCKFLCSASLDKMKGNGKEAKVEKTKLWMCLKTLFE